MKAKSVKKFGTVLAMSLLLTGLVSCGSDNEVEVTTASDTSSTSSSTASASSETTTCVSSSSFSDFRSRIANMSFMAQSYEVERYYYRDVECEEDTWWIFDTTKCEANQFTRYSNSNLSSITHENATTKEGVRDYLLTLVDNAADVTGGGSYYDITDASGNIYRISLCHTITANPVVFKNSDGSNYYEYIGKTSY